MKWKEYFSYVVLRYLANASSKPVGYTGYGMAIGAMDYINIIVIIINPQKALWEHKPLPFYSLRTVKHCTQA